MLGEWDSNGYAMLFTRQLFATIAHLLPDINGSLRWAHIAHSEGGLMARKVLSTERYKLSGKQIEYIQARLITLFCGPVLPMPKKLVNMAINLYSVGDVIIRSYGNKILDKVPKKDESYPYDCEKNGCKITVLNSDKGENKFISGDHAFSSQTYQDGLRQA